jgi:hypothetical protein
MLRTAGSDAKEKTPVHPSDGADTTAVATATADARQGC